MGKNTKNFRQTVSARAGNRGVESYAKIQREEGSWTGKLRGLFSVRGKKGPIK